jgi:phage shock protein A
MGIFTRFRDIVSSNISAMLDNAEDPEKLIKLMIREIEDTLVELKSACAGAMASKKRARQSLEKANGRMDHWAGRAELAVSKCRDDLAREALLERRRFADIVDSLNEELEEHTALVTQYQEDIVQLEERLQTSREKKRMLVQRHIHARKKRQAQEEIRRMDSSDTLSKFDDLENRIHRMEAEADLVNFGSKPSLDEQFDSLATDDDIEKELAALKSARPGQEKGGVKHG